LIPALEQGAEVLCCSFSISAAREMQSRASDILGCEPKALNETCSTIHSEALRRIMATRMDWKLYDGVNKKTKSFRRDNNVENPAAGISANFKKQRQITLRCWDFARATMVHEDPEALRRVAEDVAIAANWDADTSSDRILADIQDYEAEKRQIEGKGIDFTDMLLEALKALPRQLDLLLVDEAQDCTKLQWSLVQHWSTQARQVILIGDPDQNIHNWMGAEPHGLEDHAESMEVRKLAKSYRVPRAIHKLSRNIITQTSRRFDPQYEPAENMGSVHVTGVYKILETAASCAELRVPMFVLARSRKGLAPYAEQLIERNIPFTNERGPSPMNARKAAGLCATMIELLQGKEITRGEARILIGAMRVRSNPVWPKGVAKIDCAGGISGNEAEKLKLSDVDSESGLKLGSILDTFPTQKRSETAACLLLNSVQKAERYVELATKYSVSVLRQPPVVVLTTFHASKGREAEVVAVSAEKPYPSILAYEHEAERDAEIRCLYVAVTRSKESLLVDIDHDEIFEELIALS